MKASKKTTPADPEKKGKHVITINGKKYELTPEESARYNRLREREWSSYKKEYGNSKESELDFGSSFLGGKGAEFITSGEYKKPMKESKSEYTNRAFGEYKKALGTSENPDSLKQKDAMRAWIKDWVANNPEKEYKLGGLVKSMMPLSMKAKMKEGGKIPPQKKPVYGPPKPPGYKYPTEEEMEERRGERAYLKRRKEADRAYNMVIKEGGTKKQAEAAAEKVLSRGSYKGGGKIKYGYGGKLKKYLKGGQVKLDVNKDGKITGADFMMLRKKK